MKGINGETTFSFWRDLEVTVTSIHPHDRKFSFDVIFKTDVKLKSYMWHANIRARGHRKACHFTGQRKQMIFRTAVALDVYLLPSLGNRCGRVRIHRERESQLWSCTQQWPQTNICKEQNTNTKNANITRIMKHQQITNEITQIIEVRMYKEKERRLSPCTQCRNLLLPAANKEKLNHAIFQPETP